jgi:hypothetical protein
VWPAPAFDGHAYINGTMPLVMDVQTTPPVGPGVGPVVALGLCDYEVEQHVYMRHANDGTMIREIQGEGPVRYGFSVVLDGGHTGSTANTPTKRNASGHNHGRADGSESHTIATGSSGFRMFQTAARRMWRDAGTAELARGGSQVMPWSEYARFCYPRSLNETCAPGSSPAEWVMHSFTFHAHTHTHNVRALS